MRGATKQARAAALALAAGLGGCAAGPAGKPRAADDTAEAPGADGATGAEDGDEPTGPPLCGPEAPFAAGTVRTTSGPFAGLRRDGGGWSFLGMPYAQPPVDALRLAPPVAAACDPTPRVATVHGPLCPQLADGEVVGDEDCLQLNVFIPADAPWESGGALPADWPVLVYVHGGDHIQGGAGPDALGALADGQALSAATGSVVVTVQYRLGLLGFLGHRAVPDAMNLGIRDLQLALGWVQDNIAAFGGDPERVLLFGDRAGAANTCLMLSAPETAGRISAALLQSGACDHLSFEEADERTAGHLRALGCSHDAHGVAPEDAVDCLRAQPLEALVARSTGPVQDDLLTGVFLPASFGPVADGRVLDLDPLGAFAAGRALDVPLVVGANVDETAAWVPDLLSSDLRRLTLYAFGSEHADDRAIASLWPASEFPTPRDVWIGITTDLQYTCPARALADAASRAQTAPVRRYRFAHRATEDLADWDVQDGRELVYVFQGLDALAAATGELPTAGDRAVEAAMGAAWAGLAAGDNLTETAGWPVRFSGGLLLALDEGASTTTDPAAARCAYLAGIYP